MTVATETRSVEYDGDDTTVDFPIPFEFLEASHIRVTHYPATGSPVVLTQGTNPGYSVNGPDVKDVYPATASTPLKIGDSIVVERVVPITQEVDLTNLGTFDAETHEEVFDLGVMVDQQLNDRVKALESAGAPGSVVAGNGLSFSGTTLNVGANADGSIVVAADDVRVGVLATDTQHGVRGGGTQHAVAVSGGAAGFQSGTDKQRQDALWARTITAGAGLTGGGDLSANRTLDVAANADGSIVVNANDIQVGVINDTQHGPRGGGTTHAVATSSVAGFMSAADKTKLDGLSALSYAERVLAQTTDATVTTALNWTPTDDSIELIEAWVTALTASAVNVGGYKILAVVRRQDGTTSLVTSTTTTVGETAGAAAWDAAIDVSAPDVRVRITGAAATNINWNVLVLRRIQVFAS